MEVQSVASGSMNLDDLRTVDQLAEQYPDLLSVPALRWQLRHREQNGLAPACVRLGKKLLISRPRYEAWLASRADAPARRGAGHLGVA
jgi:hypothetical protein